MIALIEKPKSVGQFNKQINMNKSKYHVELLPAEEYYKNKEKVGAHAIGWVVLVNGQPHHETTDGLRGKKLAMDFAEQFGWSEKLNESDWKQVGIGEPSDPIIGNPAMKGRRWQIDPYGSGKSFPKINKSAKASKSLTYDKFYSKLKEVIGSDTEDVFSSQSKAAGIEEFTTFFQVANKTDIEKFNLLWDNGHTRKAWRFILSILKAAGKLNLHEIVEPAKEEDVDPKELKMGIESEMEHTNSEGEAKNIALTHLAEHPDYYSRIKSVGILELITEDVKSEDNMKFKDYYREELKEAIENDKIKNQCPCGCTPEDMCDNADECLCECSTCGCGKRNTEHSLDEKKWIQAAVHPSRKGMLSGKSVADLEKMKGNLKKRNTPKKEKGEKVPHKNKVAMSQINFALRAKKHKLTEADNSNLFMKKGQKLFAYFTRVKKFLEITLLRDSDKEGWALAEFINHRSVVVNVRTKIGYVEDPGRDTLPYGVAEALAEANRDSKFGAPAKKGSTIKGKSGPGQVAEDRQETPDEKEICPECGKKEVTVTFEQGYQEYPGASPQAPTTFRECGACGWDELTKGKFDMDNAIGLDGQRA
jgi:hypothetical protein